MNRFRWFQLIIGCISLLFSGILYAWSILKAPLADAFSWTPTQLAFNFTLTLCFFCLGGLAGGLLSKKASLRIRLIVSAALVAIGYFAASRLTGTGIVPLYLSYGVLAGSGIGIAYNAIIATTNAWFPDRKGLCSGCLLMSFGLSTLLLGGFAGILIESPSFGWRSTYLLLGIAIGAVLLLASFLMKTPPADFTASLQANKKKAAAATDQINYSGKEVLRRASFWKLFIFFILLASVGSTAISFAKDFSMSLGVSTSTAIAFVGILSVCNGLGRLVSGAFFDAFGLRKTQILTSAVVISASGLTLIATLTGFVVLGIIGLCLCGFSYGFSPTVSAATTAAFYGMKHFAMNLSLINLVLIPASFVPTLAGSLVSSSGSYVSIFTLLTAFSIVGLFVNLSIKRA